MEKIIQALNNFIGWFDGKKTAIASALLVTSAFLTEVVIGKWEVSSELIKDTVETLNWIGMVLGGVGLGHKGIKAMNK